MNPTRHLPSAPGALPDRRLVTDCAYVAYFLLLLLAPLAVPPLLSEVAAVSYVDALVRVLQVVTLGYVAGVAALLRPA